MKRVFILLAVVTMCHIGCSREDYDSQVEQESGFGSMELSAKSEIDVESLTKATVDLPESVVPSTSDFSLLLTGTYVDYDTNETESYYASYPSVAGYNEELPMLQSSDDYHATISYGDADAEGEDCAAFAGSLDFEIVARKASSAEITASLVNSAIRLECSEWFKNYYTDATFTVTTASGSTFTFDIDDDASTLIFVKAGTELMLEGSATKSNGFDVSFQKESIGVTTKRTISTIVIDAGEAGGGSISINFDESTVDVDPIDVELNPEV